MGISAGRLLLRVVGGLGVLAGLFLWVGSAFRTLSDLDAVTPASDAGGRMVAWVLCGAVLMIAGLALLQFESHGAELDAHGEGEHPGESTR
jgi:hypothetical protein